ISVSAAYGVAKQWPLERFIAAIRECSTRVPGTLWLHFGELKDWNAGQELERAAPNSVVNLAGKTSLRELMALLKRCRVLLTNDSGPMHVGAALGIRIVAPFGSTAPELTGPGLPGDTRHYLL